MARGAGLDAVRCAGAVPTTQCVLAHAVWDYPSYGSSGSYVINAVEEDTGKQLASSQLVNRVLAQDEQLACACLAC